MSKRHRQNRSAINPQELLEALRQGGFQWTGNPYQNQGQGSPMQMPPSPPMGNPMANNMQSNPMAGNPQNSLSALAGLLNGQNGGSPLPPMQPPQQGNGGVPNMGNMPPLSGMMGMPPMGNINQQRQNPRQSSDATERAELKKLLKEVIFLLKGEEKEDDD